MRILRVLVRWLKRPFCNHAGPSRSKFFKDGTWSKYCGRCGAEILSHHQI